jgi:5-methylcytosine-specific restriction endonuclease McrA
MPTKRDYAKEYREYQGTPAQLRRQSERHKARRKMGLKTGDPREVDHKVPLSKGGSNSRSNLRVVSRTTNRKKGAR